MIATVAPIGRQTRISSESAWPLRNAAGLTFAEAKARKYQHASPADPGTTSTSGIEAVAGGKDEPCR